MEKVAQVLVGLLLFIFNPLAVMGQQERAVVADSVTGEPLSGASVLDRNGRMIGMTSKDGCVPYVAPEGYPISIRFMGYAPVTVTSSVTGKILMKETMSVLPEVVVESGRRRVLHLLGYVREYSTLTNYSDTVFLFREKMVDFMIPTKGVRRFKGWTNPRLLKSRSYYHFRDAYGRDSVGDVFPEHFSWADWIGIAKRVDVPECLRDVESGTDTLAGKYNTAMIWRKSDDHVYLDVDVLSDTSNYGFVPSLRGYIANDMDFRRLNLRFVFDGVYGGTVSADNLTSMSFNIESNGRGRNLNRVLHSHGAAYVETYVEMYIVDKKYISEKEARKWESKNLFFNDVRFRVPDAAPELSPYIQNLIVRVDNIDHDAIRLAIEPDQRMISRIKKRKRSFLHSVKSMLGL